MEKQQKTNIWDRSKILNFFSIPFALLNFLIWVLFYADAQFLADDVFGRDINNSMYIFIVVFLVFALSIKFIKKVYIKFWTVISALSWITVLIVQLVLEQSISGLRVLTPKIRAALFVFNDFWLFMIIGLSSNMLLISIIWKRTLLNTKYRRNNAMEFMVAFLFGILFCLGYNFLQTFQLHYAIGVLLSSLLFFENTEDLMFKLKGINKVKTPIHATLTGVSSIYICMFLGVVSFNYYVAPRVFILLFLGMFLAFAILEIIFKLVHYSFSWQFLHLIAILGVFFESIWLYNKFEYTDSSYITNPPVPAATVVSGLIMGIFLYSIGILYMQFQIKEINTQPTSSEKGVISKIRGFLREKSRMVLFMLIVDMIFLIALLELTKKSYDSSTKEILDFAIPILAIFVISDFVFLLFGKKWESLVKRKGLIPEEKGCEDPIFGYTEKDRIHRLRDQYQPIENANGQSVSDEAENQEKEKKDEAENQEKEKKNTPKETKKKDPEKNLENKLFSDFLKNAKSINLVRVFFILLVLAGSLIAVIPELVPAKPDRSGFPNYLGKASGCYITEVSSMSKVSPDDLIMGSSEVESPLIQKKMAKNEFENVQIVLSNWGVRDIEVLDVFIENSSHGGYPSGFSGLDIIKDWKGEDWVWPRFSAQYVSSIQPGYPNIIYELNGDQTQAALVKGQDESRPKPVVKAGKTLSLWLTLYAPDSIEEGMHSDTITIETSEWSREITLETEIWNFTLPVDDKGFRTAIGNRRVYMLENRDEWTKNFLKHRISPYFPYNIRSDYYEIENNEVTFNFTQMEIDLENAIQHGQDSFRVTFKPGGIQKGCFTESFNKTTISYYSQLGDFLQSHPLDGGGTWLDLGLVYAMDEPDEDEYDLFNTWSRLIHQAHENWSVLLTEQVEEPLIENVDIWCPHIMGMDTSNIASQKALGKEYWYYTCCRVVNQPTQSFVDPSADHRALFWYAFANNIDGASYLR